MYDYISAELPALIEQHFSVSDRQSIFGHSMGGHGALMMAFRNPQRFRSVSAFAPIVNPCQSRGAARRSPPIWAATKASGCSTTVAICWPAARRKCRSLSIRATTTSSRRPAAAGAVSGAGAPARLAADAAHSAGVRSQLLHHRHLRGRSPALPRRAPVPLIKKSGRLTARIYLKTINQKIDGSFNSIPMLIGITNGLPDL